MRESYRNMIGAEWTEMIRSKSVTRFLFGSDGGAKGDGDFHAKKKKKKEMRREKVDTAAVL